MRKLTFILHTKSDTRRKVANLGEVDSFELIQTKAIRLLDTRGERPVQKESKTVHKAIIDVYLDAK